MRALTEPLRRFFSSGLSERSDQKTLIDGRMVPYQLVRSNRRSIGLTIDARGLRVGAPLHLPLPDIERFLESHRRWVLRKLDEWAPMASDFMPIEGAQLPILGQGWRLRLASGRNQMMWQEASRELWLYLRMDADPRKVLRRCLQDHALDVFLARAARFSDRLQRALPPIALSNAKTRWGSCSQLSGVRLNWRLIHLPYPQIDYVIAHEFAHLSHMDHSPRFWAEVRRLYPDFEGPLAELKRLAASIPKI